MLDLKDNVVFETDEDEYDTVMEDDISFTGKIKFSTPLMIKGKVNGNLESTSDLFIDSQAVVNADIVANRVLVKGSVKGNINGKELVYVSNCGSVMGDVTTAQIVLEPGAKFSGKSTMINQ